MPDAEEGPPPELAEYFRLYRGRWECTYPAGASDGLIEAIHAEQRRLEGKGVGRAP